MALAERRRTGGANLCIWWFSPILQRELTALYPLWPWLTLPLSTPQCLVLMCSVPTHSRAVLTHAFFIERGEESWSAKRMRTVMALLSITNIGMFADCMTITWNKSQQCFQIYGACLSKETRIIWNWHPFFFPSPSPLFLLLLLLCFFFFISNKCDKTLKINSHS